ncbi:MAG: DUF924 family protein [Candidatus Omnitrophota bacterium]|nr:DUF924 family protein [Candidatus Omnitrophota bacterium]MDZ4243433.1 DUF924 family protein [Candidatus Omnitrophota bacterium]
MDKIEQILQFWFRGLSDETAVDRKVPPFSLWFAKNDDFDREIRDTFGADWEKASRREYREWEDTPRGRLALIILFDQFSRNMFRNTPKMFATDPLALELALRSIPEGADIRLQLIERTFAYMPLMHSEELQVQKLALERFQSLVDEARLKIPGNVSYYEYSLGYARRHHDIIERFGRFPHRNLVLNRISTPEEIEFLRKPGSGF